MKRKKLILACAALLGAFAFQSCNKDSNVLPAPSPVPAAKALLLGDWLLTSRALDANRDGIIQSSESIPMQTGDYGSLTVTNTDLIDSVKYDGRAFKNTYPYTLNGDSLTYTTANGTLTLIVNRVTSTNLELYGRSVTVPDVWFFYKRM